MEFKDYYETLSIDRSASDDEIKRAYRRMARKYHPDVSKEADADVRFKEMKEAYEVLKDPKKRAAYDQFGEHWKTGQDFQPPPQWNRGFDFDPEQFTTHGSRHEGFSDFFESLFAQERSPQGNVGRGDFRQSGHRGMRMDGEDVNTHIIISIEDAYRGATRQISFDVSEMDEQGHVVRKRRTLNVSIPKGVKSGQRIRLENQGGPGIGAGSLSGDLYLKVEYEPHPVFDARGRHIHVTLPVTPSEAALGRTVKVPTLGGTVDLKLPPGSSTGKRLRLKGRGLPGSPPGDQYVDLSIVIPKRLDRKTRELYEQLEQIEQSETFHPRAGMEA